MVQFCADAVEQAYHAWNPSNQTTLYLPRTVLGAGCRAWTGVDFDLRADWRKAEEALVTRSSLVFNLPKCGRKEDGCGGAFSTHLEAQGPMTLVVVLWRPAPTNPASIRLISEFYESYQFYGKYNTHQTASAIASGGLPLSWQLETKNRRGCSTRVEL